MQHWSDSRIEPVARRRPCKPMVGLKPSNISRRTLSAARHIDGGAWASCVGIK